MIISEHEIHLLVHNKIRHSLGVCFIQPLDALSALRFRHNQHLKQFFRYREQFPFIGVALHRICSFGFFLNEIFDSE